MGQSQPLMKKILLPAVFSLSFVVIFPGADMPGGGA